MNNGLADKVIASFEQPGQDKAKKPVWKPQVVRLSDVEPEIVQWLWEPYIAKRKVTLMEGDPGMGKTTLALTLAAAVTRGWPLPGDELTEAPARPPGNVIFLGAEDGVADTVRPRADAAGADPSRVFVITGKEKEEDGETKEASISLGDIETLRVAVEEIRPDLVIIDPLQGFLGAGVDMHRANEVRPILSAFAALAEEYGFAAVAIRHLRKSGADRAVHRGMGSIDFAAFARSIILVAEDPENERLRVMAHVKSSLAPAGASLAFELGHEGLLWAGESTFTPDQLLAPRKNDDERSLQDAAITWLREELFHGAVLTRKLKQDCEDAGFSWATVRRAQSALGVIAERSGTQPSAPWQWRLPPEEHMPKGKK